MKQLSLETLFEETSYRSYPNNIYCFDSDVDYYDVNEYMMNDIFFDEYIVYQSKSYVDCIRYFHEQFRLARQDGKRMVLTRYSPRKDKYVIVADSANM